MQSGWIWRGMGRPRFRIRRQDAFQGKGFPLYQVQIDHPAQRAITFQIRDAMNDFLRQQHDADASMPGTVQELERQLGVRLVVSDRTDPEEVGYVQWRTAVVRRYRSLGRSVGLGG